MESRPTLADCFKFVSAMMDHKHFPLGIMGKAIAGTTGSNAKPNATALPCSVPSNDIDCLLQCAEEGHCVTAKKQRHNIT